MADHEPQNRKDGDGNRETLEKHNVFDQLPLQAIQASLNGTEHRSTEPQPARII
mgnify:CR=1 FL=1